jgi:hypothetical protein
MARFRWRSGDRKGAWHPTRREAVRSAKHALRRLRATDPDGFDEMVEGLIEVANGESLV